MVVAWMALRPGIYRQVVQESELSEPNAKAATNALGKLPASYGDVPRLGPPLPGDLGRPIMKAQREMVPEEGVSTGQPAADAAAAAHPQERAEQKAAREAERKVEVAPCREGGGQ